MALALPSPFIDTGITATHTLAFDLSIRAQDPNGLTVLDLVEGLDPPTIYTEDVAGTVTVYMDTSTTTGIVLGSGASGGAPPAWIGPFLVTRVVGPMRLGVTIDAGLLVYQWFEDEGTTRSLTVGGNLVYSFTYPVNTPPVQVGSGRLFWNLHSHSGVLPFSAAKLESFTFNAVSLGIGPYELHNNSRFFGAPFKWRVSLETLDENGAAITPDVTYNAVTSISTTRDITVQPDAVAALPAQPVRPEQLTGVATLADPWLSAQTIQPYTDEWPFTIEGNAPKTPGAGFTVFSQGTMRINSPLDVLLSTNAWLATGSIVVGGGATPPTTFTVTGAGFVTRALREHWRFWNTPAHALEIIGENYTATLRNAYPVDANTPDRWGWSLYSYLDIDLTIPGAQTLTITLTWVVITEEGLINSLTRAYTKTWAASGVQRIDLLFPDAGDTPFYGDRIDSIKLEGFVNGVTTLNDMELFAGEDAYVQLGWQTKDPQGGIRPAGFKIVQDGQWTSAHWNGDSDLGGDDTDVDFEPDRAKDHQNGLFEFAPVETDPVLGDSYGGPVGMGAETIALSLAELGRMEGLTVTPSTTALDAALTDTFGSVLTPTRVSEWVLPVMPHQRLAKNTNLTINARLIYTDVSLVAGRAFTEQIITQKNRLGSVLEGQGRVASTGARSGAGITVNAKAYVGESVFAPTGADATIASSTTDASGYVAIPVRTGKFLALGVPTTWGAYLE